MIGKAKNKIKIYNKQYFLWLLAKLPNPWAIFTGMFLIRFIGKNIITPKVLNKICCTATVIARGFPVTKEAIHAVTVVPIFEPIA